MVFSGIITAITDSVRWVVTEAPAPIRAALWVFMFMALAGVLNFFFTFTAACTTDEQLYTPDNTYWAFRTQFKRIALSNNINYTLINQTGDIEEPSLWSKLWNFVNFGDDSEVEASYSDYYDAAEAARFDQFIRDHGQLREYADNELVTIGCSNENAQLLVAGINISDKGLWFVAGFLVILWPMIAIALKRKHGG